VVTQDHRKEKGQLLGNSMIDGHLLRDVNISANRRQGNHYVHDMSKTVTNLTNACTTSGVCMVRRLRVTKRGVEEVCTGEENSRFAHAIPGEIMQ